MNRVGRFVRDVLLLLIAAGASIVGSLGAQSRPMHIDESIHVVRFTKLAHGEGFDYDPGDFHGPTLYYLTLLFPARGRDAGWVSASDFRLVPMACWLGVLGLMASLMMRNGRWDFTRPELLCSIVLLAASPAFAYYGAQYIMEMPLVAFSFGAILCGSWWVRRRSFPVAVFFGACLGLMHATKETCVLIWAAMAAGASGAWVWGRFSPLRAALPVFRAGRSWGTALLVLTAAVLVSVAAFSVGFTNWQNVPKSVTAFGSYLHRAGGAGLHAKPWTYYFHILGFYRTGDGPVFTEALILVLAIVGIVAVVLRSGPAERDPRLTRFLVCYTVVLTAIYSAIPYKTPWTILTALHGMILLAGLGAVAIFRWTKRWRGLRILVVILGVAGVVHLGYQAVLANTRYADDPRSPYAYAQTRRDYWRLVDRVRELAEAHPDGQRMVIKVVTKAENHWPLPWSLRQFERVGYWERMPTDPAAPVVITEPAFEAAMDRNLGQTHTMIGYFELRYGVFLEVYVENELWRRMVASRPAVLRRVREQ